VWTAAQLARGTRRIIGSSRSVAFWYAAKRGAAAVICRQALVALHPVQLLPSSLRPIQRVEADQRTRQVHEPQQEVGAPLVAHLQPPTAHQPRQRSLHIPMAAKPLARLDPAAGDPRGDPRRRSARRQRG
jgi:hypothetical protein